MYKKVLCLLFIAAAVFSFGDYAEAKKKYLDPNGNLTTRRKAEARWDKEYIRREKRDLRYQERRSREIYHDSGYNSGNDYGGVNGNMYDYGGDSYYDGGDYYEGDYSMSPVNPNSIVQQRLRSRGRRNKNASSADSAARRNSRGGSGGMYNGMNGNPAPYGNYPGGRPDMLNSAYNPAMPYGGAPGSNFDMYNPAAPSFGPGEGRAVTRRAGGRASMRRKSGPAYTTNVNDKVAAARREIERANIPDDKRDFVNGIQAGLNSSDRMEQYRAVAEWNHYRRREGVLKR